MTPARLLQALGLAAGVFGLLLQFVLTIPASMAAGRSLAGSIIFYFSFFTILTNILAAATHAAGLDLTGVRLMCLQKPRVSAGVAVAIAVVGIVYFVILARLWQPQGWWLAADVTLHYVTPVLFVGWWLAAGTDGTTRWSDPVLWLAWPVAYTVYALARAPITGEVPYPFLDYEASGWGHVAQAIGGIVVLFVGLGAVAVMTDRALARWRARQA